MEREKSLLQGVIDEGEIELQKSQVFYLMVLYIMIISKTQD